MITIIQDKNSNQRSIKNSNQVNVNTSNQVNVNTSNQVNVNTSNQVNVNTSNQGNVNTISTISINPKKRRFPNLTDTSGHNSSSSSIIKIDTNKNFILKLQFLSAIENIKIDKFINQIIEDFYNNIYLKEKNILPYLKPKIESDTTLEIEIKNKNLKYVKEMTLSNEKDFLEFFLPEQINILLKKQSETY